MEHKIGSHESTEREEYIFRRIVVKIGSSTITGGKDMIDANFMNDMARQMSMLFYTGVEVCLVTSGAVACGRNSIRGYDGRQEHRQLAAATGQIELMFAWRQAFAQYQIPVFQVLVSPDTIPSSVDFLGNCKGYGIPIVNANDPLNTAELDQLGVCADNDNLSANIAQRFSADGVFLLTDTAVRDIHGKEVPFVSPDFCWQDSIHFSGKSEHGTGGMESKHHQALGLARNGITTIIADARKQDILLRGARGLSVGTTYRL